MKKILLFLGLTALSSTSFAYWDTVGNFKSSYTITNEQNALIPRTVPGSIFVGVILPTTTTNATLKIYDSSGTANNQIANIDMARSGAYRYDVVLSSGLTYSISNNANGVTILYKRLRE